MIRFFQGPLHKILLTTFGVLCNFLCRAQNESWDMYLAQYDDGPGSTTLNMAMKEKAPMSNLPFVVVTGVTYKKCDDDGFPQGNEFAKLYEISDSVVELLSRIKTSEFVGSFTQSCDRLVYVYVNDTLNVRAQLANLYSEKFPSYESYISIRHDPQWESYLEFLYPSEEILEWMSNDKVLTRLSEAGDKLEKPRQVDHWLYFHSEADRESFIRFARQNKFKVEGVAHSKEFKMPYQLHISRMDKVNPQSINTLTAMLRSEARKLNGDYDGWESVVVRD